ncbi:hypothetical protein [Paenarthrobacter sp. 22069]|uniref:hypothetical protein n=1 Tax=Paenarthrobacter sp. 22069 TaxID=3453864 RepID=UPI003F84AA3C
MKTLTNTAGKLLATGAATIGISAAAVVIRANARDRKRDEDVAMFRPAEENTVTHKAARVMRALSVISLGVSLMAGVLFLQGLSLAGGTLLGVGIALVGAAWTQGKDERGRLAWIPLAFGSLLFVGSLIALCVTG